MRQPVSLSSLINAHRSIKLRLSSLAIPVHGIFTASQTAAAAARRLQLEAPPRGGRRTHKPESSAERGASLSLSLRVGPTMLCSVPPSRRHRRRRTKEQVASASGLENIVAGQRAAAALPAQRAQLLLLLWSRRSNGSLLRRATETGERRQGIMRNSSFSGSRG